MAQTLRLKRSSVAGRVPTTATLQTGEIAINTADGLVYIRKDDDNIIPLIGVNTAAVTGSVVLLGSITATSFTGSFTGDFSGSINATLSTSASSGAGIVTFTFDGSDNVTVSLDTGSAHFVDGVNDLIAVGTALSASYAVTASFAQNAALAQTAVTASYTLVAQEVLGLDTGSFVTTGSISDATITLNQAVGTSFTLTVNNVANATSASYAATASIATSSSFAENANAANTANTATSSSYATSASYAVTSDTATSASYVLSASYSTFSTFASNAAEVLITGYTLAPDKYYLTFTTGSGYNFLQIDSEVLSYLPATNTLDHKGLLIVSGNILLTGVVVGDDILINDWGSVSASLAAIEIGANNLTLQQVTDNGSSTTNSITATSFTGSLFGTASYALVAETALNVNTGSLLVTGSVSGATITLTKGDGSTFDLTVASTATASYALTASYAEGYVKDGGGAVNQITVWSDGETVTGYSTFVRDSNGNLGIGTSSPVRSIDVVSGTGTSVGLKLNSTATGGRSYSFFSTNNASGLGGGKFGIYDDTAQAGRIVLDGTGNVGIGSTSPIYKLDVVGDSRVTGDLTVTGKVTAEEFHTEFVSSSIIYSSGSTKFGDTIDDVHQFTGSVFISGSTVVTGSLTAPDITINDWGSVSASLATISGSAASAYGLTLQEVTDNGNQTTNHVSISSSLNVQDSIYSKGEEVLDFAVAMAIALG